MSSKLKKVLIILGIFLVGCFMMFFIFISALMMRDLESNLNFLVEHGCCDCLGNSHKSCCPCINEERMSEVMEWSNTYPQSTSHWSSMCEKYKKIKDKNFPCFEKQRDVKGVFVE